MLRVLWRWDGTGFWALCLRLVAFGGGGGLFVSEVLSGRGEASEGCVEEHR